MIKQDKVLNTNIEQKILSALIVADGKPLQADSTTEALFNVLVLNDFSRLELANIFSVAKKIFSEKGCVPELDLRIAVNKEITDGNRRTDAQLTIDTLLNTQDTFPRELVEQLVPELKRLKIDRELPIAVERASIAAAQNGMSFSAAVEKFVRPLIDDDGKILIETDPLDSAISAFEKRIAAYKVGKIDESNKIPLGYRVIDSLLRGGLHSGQLMILGARPAVGKTTLALNFTLNILKNTNKRVAFVSLEQTADELFTKMVSASARITMPETQAEFNASFGRDSKIVDKFIAARNAIDTSRLDIVERTENVAHLINTLTKIKRDKGLDIVFIDYLQLVPFRGERSRYEAVTNISNALKRAAKGLDLPILCLAQVNRANDRENRAPRLSDLRDSGAVEQDADVAALLYDESDEATEEEVRIDPNHRSVVFDVQKNRAGPISRTRFLFTPKMSLFEQR